MPWARRRDGCRWEPLLSPWPFRWPPAGGVASKRNLFSWFKQAVEVDDEVAHMRVIDRLLRLGAPYRLRLGVVRIDADNVERLQIRELDLVRRRQFASEYEVEKLSLFLLRHVASPLLLKLSDLCRWERCRSAAPDTDLSGQRTIGLHRRTLSDGFRNPP